ncbi:hypothetical protein WMF26_45460 [Sorangium sp. So ce185]|uniref:hypothetical protein n=1 Tax=Sorangium sp. So ce185 TaxID=3133287 RepID=UPI003F643434
MAELDQVAGDGPELARRFYLKERIPWPRGVRAELGQTDARVAAGVIPRPA